MWSWHYEGIQQGLYTPMCVSRTFVLTSHFLKSYSKEIMLYILPCNFILKLHFLLMCENFASLPGTWALGYCVMREGYYYFWFAISTIRSLRYFIWGIISALPLDLFPIMCFVAVVAGCAKVLHSCGSFRFAQSWSHIILMLYMLITIWNIQEADSLVVCIPL